MYIRLLFFCILALAYACAVDDISKESITDSTALPQAKQPQSMQSNQQPEKVPTFDSTDDLFDRSIQNAQTALGKNQFQSALDFANEALDRAQFYYSLQSKERIRVHRLFADIYEKQKQHAAAEKHFQQAYTIQKKLFGEKDETSLKMLEQLGQFYQKWGKKNQTEEILQQINKLYLDKHGSNHEKTLDSVNQLAGLYIDDRQFVKARPYVSQAVKISTHLFGKHSRHTLSYLIQAAKTYYHCKAYSLASQEFERALTLIEGQGGKPADVLLDIYQYLAKIHMRQKEYHKAEKIFKKAIGLSQKVLGPKNTVQLAINEKLIQLYQSQGRTNDIKMQLHKTIALTSKVLGDDHPDTIAAQKALADLYFDEKEYTHAEKIYAQALQLSKKRYGAHEITFSLSKRLAETYIAQSKFKPAENLLQNNVDIHQQILEGTRENLHHLALLYKMQNNCADAISLIDQTFRLNESTLGPSHPKTLQALSDLIGCLIKEDQKQNALNLLKRIEPSLYKAHWETICTGNIPSPDSMGLNAHTFCHAVFTLIRDIKDPEEISYGAEVMLRWHYLNHFPGAVNKRLPGYHDLTTFFQRQMVNLPYRLPRNSAFILLYPYKLMDFSTSQTRQTRWLSILILSEEENNPNIFCHDLGEINVTQQLIKQVKSNDNKADSESKLYQHLFGVFEKHIQQAQSVYISTSGLGQMIPFSRLRLGDGRYWIERQPVCRVFSALDFIRKRTQAYTGSFLAVGQVNYDNFFQPESGVDSETLSKKSFQKTGRIQHIPLPDKQQIHIKYRAYPDEARIIEDIMTLYTASRTSTPVFWSDTRANESALKTLIDAPRIMHLAVDCFYLPQKSILPCSIHSGLALAGANKGLMKKTGPDGHDGLLLDKEILDMNLNETELVFLTKKCDSRNTGIHFSAYFQMAAAFHMAGCRFVLSPVWRVNHAEAGQFILLFYENWLGQSISSPAKALRKTQLQFISQGRPAEVWGSYTLMGF